MEENKAMGKTMPVGVCTTCVRTQTNVSACNNSGSKIQAHVILIGQTV